jgi:hypothetical protein
VAGKLSRIGELTLTLGIISPMTGEYLEILIFGTIK